MERERGLALVSVLWTLSILSLIAASMMSTGSLSVAMERNALRHAQTDRIAESAIALGIIGLLDPRPEKRWRVDGMAQDVAFAGIAALKAPRRPTIAAPACLTCRGARRSSPSMSWLLSSA